ncbi:MAG: hypothetical protein V4754_04375 [Pseudomonadota bacterium]
MMKRLLTAAACAVSMLTLPACGMLPSASDPVREQQYVSVVNSLSWTDATSGKRDGRRSSWPLDKLSGQVEAFPLAQLKQCDGAGACAWGMLRAERKLVRYSYVPGGVKLELELMLDVDRRQEAHGDDYHAAMAVPSDVPVLRMSKTVQPSVILEYGKVHHVQFDYGVRFDVCALRYDAAGGALDHCDIPYI